MEAESCGLIRSSGRLTGACSRLLFPSYATRCRYDVPGVLASGSGLEAMLAEGALESPSVLVLAFHSSLFLVRGLSDGLAAGDRFLSPGRMCLTHSVPVEISRLCALCLRVGFSCSSGSVGELLSDPVPPFLEETFEVPMWVGSSSSLPGLSSDCSHPGLSWLPLTGFDFAGLVDWLLLAPRNWEPPSRSTPFSRFVTFWRLCGASWGPPLFPRSLRHALAYCLAAWPLPLYCGSRVHGRASAGLI